MEFRWFLLLAALCHLAGAALPNGWKPCRKSDGDQTTCLKTEITKAIKSLKNGDRKLGVLPIDPLFIEKLELNSGTGPVSIKMSLLNLTFEGLSNPTFLDIKNNDWKQLKSKILLKKLVTKGNYKIQGKILTLPVAGDGPCVITWDELMIDLDHKVEPRKINGKNYFKTTGFSAHLKPKKVHFKFDNLFNGNKELGDTTNLFVNENWEQITQEVSPSLEKAINEVFTQLADRVLSKIPIEEIVID